MNYLLLRGEFIIKSEKKNVLKIRNFLEIISEIIESELKYISLKKN